MGSCVSVHKNSNPALKLALHIEAPMEEKFAKSQPSVAEVGFKPQLSTIGHVDSFQDLNTTDTFFDSHLWLESDCEDYFSVNGDLTPSCNETPIHQKSSAENSLHEKALCTDNTSNTSHESSPTEMKKQLIELFRESLSGEFVTDDQNLKKQLEDKPSIPYSSQTSTNRSPCESIPGSVNSTRTTPGYIHAKEKSRQSVQCCFPRLVRSFSLGERKKRLGFSKTGGW